MNIEEALRWLDENNAFVNEERRSLTSGITRKLKSNEVIFNNFKEMLNTSSDDPAEIIYNIVNPNCSKVCEVCGKPTSFDKFYNGYKKACCRECSNKLTVSKGSKTKEERYGSATYNNPEKNKETLIRNHGASNYRNVEKSKQTKLERYGDSNFNNKEKAKKTCLERYGVVNPMHSTEIKEKLKASNLEKYGVEWSSQIESARRKQRTNKVNRFLKEIFEDHKFGDNVELLFTQDDYTTRYKDYPFKCKECGEVFYWNFRYNSSKPYCKACHPSEIAPFSKDELELFDFIKSIYNGPIYRNSRSVIAPLELDIYIPEKNIAIEYNGLFWHSELWKDKGYHLTKTKMCEKLGIRLIHIFEDEWLEKRAQVESLLKNALGVYDKVIGARKCEVKIVEDKKLCKEFLNNNHIQGYTPYKYNYGLYYEDELVSLLTFSVPRYNKDYDFELIRFACKNGYHIHGAFSKLLKAFRKEFNGSILTYSDRRMFTGDVYRNNGFAELTPTAPDYWYVNFKENKGRESRILYQKKKLIEKYGKEFSELTEREIANKHSCYQIYGCGNWKFELKN